MSYLLSFEISLAMAIIYTGLWVNHYRIKDGWGRLYLLVGCAAIGLFFWVRAGVYLMAQFFGLTGETITLVHQYTVLLLALPAFFQVFYEVLRKD